MFACGDNRSGQTVGGGNTATNTTPKQINYDGPDVVKIACGAEFSMLVDKNGGVWSWGHPEHGQLGHNTDGSFLEKAGKTTFHYVYSPEKIQMWVEKDPKGKGARCFKNEGRIPNRKLIFLDSKAKDPQYVS